MKIDREQIEQMAQAMCGYCTENKRCVLKYSAPCSEVASQDCTFKESAEELICKGYGKISEYKAQIEQLKSENKSQERENDFLKYCQCLTHGVDGSNHIKKAQIDVLNKLKEKFKGYEAWYYNGIEEGYHDLEEEIDELIKEIENDKCNC